MSPIRLGSVVKQERPEELNSFYGQRIKAWKSEPLDSSRMNAGRPLEVHPELAFFVTLKGEVSRGRTGEKNDRPPGPIFGSSLGFWSILPLWLF